MTTQNPSNLPALIHSTADVDLIAKRAAESKLYPGISTPQAAFTLMMLCQADGLHPATALRRYHIIEGKPSMKADAMLAGFQNAGGKVRWLERTDLKVSAEFSHPSGGTVTITWDMEQAKRAKLAQKDIWQKYPRQMLTARVISEGIRTILPAVVQGMYTPEEVQDFDEPRAVAPARATTRVIEIEPHQEPVALSSPAEWFALATETSLAQNADWKNRLANTSVPASERKEIFSAWGLTNGLAKRFAETGTVEWGDIAGDKPGAVNKGKAKRVMTALYAEDPADVLARLDAYLEELRARECDRLGIDKDGNPIPREEQEDEAGATETALANAMSH
jgi:hypothetical protein